jgi:branched-chain amino acid transport system ATP-binding protein
VTLAFLPKLGKRRGHGPVSRGEMGPGNGAASSGFRAAGLKVHFDGVQAVDGVDVCIAEGDILGLIGPNGAGKTTLVNAMTGFERPTAGTISLDGTELGHLSPHRLARLGVVRTFQSGRLFGRLSVLENVEAAALSVAGHRRSARQLAWSSLAKLGLTALAGRPAETLAHGDGRRLELARAIAAAPRFLLLDEPAAGLNEIESDLLVDVIAALPADLGCGVLVIEHDMRVIMRLCTRIQVLDYGKTIALGPPEQVRNDPAVRAAYLGAEGAADAAD